MSEFQDAINWLQNDEIQLLFFIIGYQEDVNPVPTLRADGIKSSKFYDYRKESTYPVVLLEIRAAVECKNAQEIVEEVFSKFAKRPEILICMFDGTYMSSEDLTDSVNIEHIFAAKSPTVSLFGCSDALRNSDTWSDDIARVQAQIVDEFGMPS